MASLLVMHPGHEHTRPSGSSAPSQPDLNSIFRVPSPILNLAVLDAIEHVLKDTREPHHIESSQNSEDKIKSLFKPVLKSLGLDDILVTKYVFPIPSNVYYAIARIQR